MLCQVPSRCLSDKEQKRLIYRRLLQFESGTVAAAQIPGSVAVKLMAKKRKLTEMLKNQLVRTECGWLQATMMDHFRSHCNISSFYSLPLSIVKQLPMQQLDLAVRSGLSIRGHGVQPSGLLPLTDADNCLPLACRPTDKTKQDAGPCDLFLGELMDEEDTSVVSGTGDNKDDIHSLAAPSADEKSITTYKSLGLGAGLLQLVESCHCQGLVMFRISDMNLAKKKRPLASADNIQAGDLALRLYQAMEVNKDGTCVWARQCSQSEVSLVQLFALKEPQEIVDHLWQWEVQPDVRPDRPSKFLLKQSQRAFQARPAPFSLEAVNVDKGLKPSLFDLHLLLANHGWKFSRPSVSAQRLKQFPVQSDRGRRYYHQRGFWHFLVLMNIDTLQRRQIVYHGQLEAYYEALFRLAARGHYIVRSFLNFKGLDECSVIYCASCVHVGPDRVGPDTPVTPMRGSSSCPCWGYTGNHILLDPGPG